MSDSDDPNRLAIIRLIEQDTRAYLNKDYDAWASGWAKTPDTRVFRAGADSSTVVEESWESFSSKIREAFDRHPEPNLSYDKIRRENMNIVVGSDIAWGTWNLIGADTGDVFDLPGLQFEMKVFHKIDGEWKIVCKTVMRRITDYSQCPLIELDASSRVLWMNTEAKAQLPNFPELVVSAGRLQAKNKARDADLQDAVAQTFHLGERDLLLTEKNYRVKPVALGEDDYSVLKYCWVSLENGRVLISFDDRRIIAQKLSWAGQVFGLSSAQKEVAELTVQGHEIAEVASRLEVTFNTVQTHLRRIYDKTGARGRQSLVRAILNMEPPIS